MAQANLIDKLNRALPAHAREALALVIRHARAQGLALYLVGGAVRDLLLDRPTLDIDLSLEGDAPALARTVAEATEGLRCVVHPTFRTASLTGPDFTLDLASARLETYDRPGALPTVRPGTLRDDLFRRDFTANAIALTLTGPDGHPPASGHRGSVIDPFDGRADLDAGLLRVLHQNSFRDDATRILRGARYESRLGLRFERDTLRWLKRDAAYLDTISGPRLRDELMRTMREAEPERILLRLHQLGALSAIHPALSFDRQRAQAFVELRRIRREPSRTAYLALLAWGLSRPDATALAARLSLTRRETEAVRAAPTAQSLTRKLSGDVRPSETVDLLTPIPLPATWALAAAAPEPARRRALRYLRRWRYARPSLDGHALMALGARPGPRLGQVLRRLKAAKLDGGVRSRRDEEMMARKLLADQRSLSQGISLQADDGLEPVPPGSAGGERSL